MSQNLLDQLLPEPSKPPSSGFNLRDLPHLDDELTKLLGFIIRNNYVARKTILNSMGEFLASDKQDIEYLDNLLNELVKTQQITLVEIDGELWYRPQIRRRSGRGDTLEDIWRALEATPQETQINDQIRRTRSTLADSILPDVTQLPPQETQASEETHDTAKTLLADLFSTARSSMYGRGRND